MNLAVRHAAFIQCCMPLANKEWSQIPGCFLNLVRVLEAKAVPPARMFEVRSQLQLITHMSFGCRPVMCASIAACNVTGAQGALGV